MRHRPEVVDLVGHYLTHNVHQISRVREVAVVEEQLYILAVVAILVQVFDAVRIEAGATANEAVYLVALLEEKFGEVGTVLLWGEAHPKLFTVYLPKANHGKRQTPNKGSYLASYSRYERNFIASIFLGPLGGPPIVNRWWARHALARGKKVLENEAGSFSISYKLLHLEVLLGDFG